MVEATAGVREDRRRGLRGSAVAETSVSLLERLRRQPGSEAWARLVDVYAPLVRGWLRRQGVAEADADDLTQEVLAVLVRELPQFRHNGRPGAFRAWLRGVTANRLRGFWRARQARPEAAGGDKFEAALNQLEDPHSALSRQWDEEHDRHVLRRLQELIEPEFSAAAWRAFRRTVLDGARAAVVAAELGMSVNAVLLAKSRVLRRLREEARGLVD
jgi:RNA polymerase sigma-70 factor (ECF subfamily)